MLQSVTNGYNSISLADKLIGKVLAYGGLQIRTSLPHGLQIPADINPCGH